ncbi:MAG: Rossmann fold domain-containing protein [Pseudomonadota bacterium]
MQQVQRVTELPDSPLAASESYFSDYLAHARGLLGEKRATSLAIVLPAAGPDHDDWRHSLARDLAREFTPRRVNIIGANDVEAERAMLVYLGNAPGVTGQYLAAHE